MRRAFTIIIAVAMVAAACGPQDSMETTSTTVVKTVATTTAETTTTTTSLPSSSSTTTPSPATTWTEQRGAVPENARFGKLLVGTPGYVVMGFHDKIPGVQGVHPGLWFSPEGSIWEEVTPTGLDLEWVELNAGVWTGSEYLVVAEGIINAENTGNDIEGDGPLLFRSVNGQDWSIEIIDNALVAAAPRLGRLFMTPELIQYPGRAGFTDITLGPEGLLITGWLDTSDGTEAAVWSSSDGEAWTVRRLPGAMPNVRADQIERGPFGYVVLGSQQVIGGGGGITSVLWRSSDEQGWELVNAHSTEYPGVEPLIPELWYANNAAVGPSGYLISGSLWSDTGAIEWHLWYSDDGKGWAETERFPGEGAYVQDMAGDDDGFIAAGCQTIDGQAFASLWRSHDGRSWTLERSESPSACIDTIERSGNRWVATGSNAHPDAAYNPNEFWRATVYIILTAPITTEIRSVVRVDSDDVLNVRSGPGVDNEIIACLSPTATGVMQTGRRTVVGSSIWVEIVIEQGTGWVNEYYLAEQD